jgi:bifunctional non-homologous end joining protein LigD
MTKQQKIKKTEKKLRADGHGIDVTNLDKVFFPTSKITKEDVIEYYRRIAPYMIPLIEKHPLSMERFPEGINHEGFFQKNIPDYFPHWVHRCTIPTREGDTIEQVLVNDTATLLYLASQAVLTFHAWLSTAHNLEKPDRMIFDLDPSGLASFSQVRFTARKLYDVLTEHHLPSYCMTTGSRGVHVVVPLRAAHSFDSVRTCASFIAQQLIKEYPRKMTLESSKEKRKNRIFIDILRNAYGATAVAPYSIRARERAPIATPIGWDELLEKRVKPQQYTIKNIFRRLGRISNPWEDFEQKATTLDHLIERMKVLGH